MLSLGQTADSVFPTKHLFVFPLVDAKAKVCGFYSERMRFHKTQSKDILFATIKRLHVAWLHLTSFEKKMYKGA